MSVKCPRCNKPAPADYCHEGVVDCPLEVPPRFLGVTVLWGELRRLQRRMEELEKRKRLVVAYREKCCLTR